MTANQEDPQNQPEQKKTAAPQQQLSPEQQQEVRQLVADIEQMLDAGDKNEQLISDIVEKGLDSLVGASESIQGRVNMLLDDVQAYHQRRLKLLQRFERKEQIPLERLRVLRQIAQSLLFYPSELELETAELTELAAKEEDQQ